jgi:hypothetical protein
MKEAPRVSNGISVPKPKKAKPEMHERRRLLSRIFDRAAGFWLLFAPARKVTRVKPQALNHLKI